MGGGAARTRTANAICFKRHRDIDQDFFAKNLPVNVVRARRKIAV